MKHSRLIVAGLLLALTLTLTGCQAYQTRIKNERAERHRVDAEAYLSRGETDLALVAFNEALEDNPRLTAAHLGIGSIMKDRGNLEEASEAYRKAVDTDANSFEARHQYGLVNHLMGRLREAVKSYLAAIPIEPNNAEVRRHLASAYMQLGDPASALPHARKAAELNPDSQPDWANLAANYAMLSRHEDAVNAYRQAAELGDMEEHILLGLADAHIKLGNYARAINTLNTLIYRTGPSASSTAYERLGVAQYRLRRYEDALASFEKAVGIDPTDTAALNGIGAAYMTLYIEGERANTTQKAEALSAWRRSLRLRPSQPQITDLLSRYSTL